MPSYKAPVEDTLFILNDVLGIERYNNLPGFADATPDMIEAIVGEAAKLAEEVLFPVNLSGDQEGCKRMASSRHSIFTARAAGSGLPCRKNSAARACPTRSTLPSANICPRPTWR
jgi:hypothetical protein